MCDIEQASGEGVDAAIPVCNRVMGHLKSFLIQFIDKIKWHRQATCGPMIGSLHNLGQKRQVHDVIAHRNQQKINTQLGQRSTLKLGKKGYGNA